MRVFIGLQIPSEDIIGVLWDCCDPAQYDDDEEMPDIKDFEPMIKIFQSVDRLVDIMNSSAYKNGKDKDVELINSSTHHHIEELFGIWRKFEEWKQECKGSPKDSSHLTLMMT